MGWLESAGLGPGGEPVWNDAASEVGDSPDAEPTLRQVSAETAAVISHGDMEVAGQSTAGYAAAVVLFYLEDGEVLLDTIVTGTESDTPTLSGAGLVFRVDGGDLLVISPEGEETKVTHPQRLRRCRSNKRERIYAGMPDVGPQVGPRSQRGGDGRRP